MNQKQTTAAPTSLLLLIERGWGNFFIASSDDTSLQDISKTDDEFVCGIDGCKAVMSSVRIFFGFEKILDFCITVFSLTLHLTLLTWFPALCV
jgi:hypothetical protein